MTITVGPATTPVTEICAQCGKPELHASEDACRACAWPVAGAAPNVRHAKRIAPVLLAKYREHEATTPKAVLEALLALARNTVAVVTVPIDFAFELLVHGRRLYTSYHNLAAAGVRSPAPSGDDARRRIADALLYGSAGSEIRFALLSTDGTGLPTWGEVDLELDEVTIAYRSTVLIANSYDVVKTLDLKKLYEDRGDIGLDGMIATWDQRDLLCALKLSPRISQNTAVDLASLFITRTSDRRTNDFFEVHIYGYFNNQAIRQITLRAPAPTGDTLHDKIRQLHHTAVPSAAQKARIPIRT